MQKMRYKTDQNNPQVRAYKDALERGRRNHHVLQRNGEWVVKKAGSQVVSRVFSTQEEAVTYGDFVARSAGTALFIHGNDGKITDRKDF